MPNTLQMIEEFDQQSGYKNHVHKPEALALHGLYISTGIWRPA